MDVTATLFISSILFQSGQILTGRGFGHNNMAPIEWKGIMVAGSVSFSAGIVDPQYGGAWLTAWTKDDNGKKIEANFGAVLFGFGWEENVNLFSKSTSVTLGTFSVTVPSWLGYSPNRLGGAISWAGGSAGVVGTSIFAMGFGLGSFTIDPREMFREGVNLTNQFGVETMSGLCIPMGSNY
jgi:hypothetical protein